MTHRIETIGECVLHMADCRDVLPTLEPVDLICTDAPYRVTTGGMDQRSRLGFCGRVGEKHKSVSGFGGWLDAGYSNNGEIVTCNIEWSDWMPLAFDALKPDRQAYFMTNGRSLAAAQAAAEVSGFDLHTVLVWDKRSALPNRWYQNLTEFTLFMKKGRAFMINDPSSKNIISLFQRDESKHPTEKPVELMAQYIGNSTQRGQTVLDPFMGSGTTGVAAARLGRKFIGVELEERWFDVACERIRKATDEAYLFAEPLPMPVETQPNIFDAVAE